MNPKEIRVDQRYLHAHRVLMRTALSAVSVFMWVFVFSYFLSFSFNLARAFAGTITVYALSQAIMIILTPLSAAHLRHGVKRAIVFGALFLAAALVTLGATFAGYFSAPLGCGIVLFGVLLGAYRALYWIPYRLQSHLSFTDHPNIFLELIIAFMPAFVGIAIASVYLAPLKILFGMAALTVLSTLPVLFLRDVHEGFSWSYLGTFRELFRRRNTVHASRAVLDGIQSAALFLIWPIAVFLIVGRSYLTLGVVMSASLVIFLVLHSAYRSTSGAFSLRESPIVTVVFVVSAWIFRLAAGTPIAIMCVDSYSFLSAPRGRDSYSLEHSSDGGTYLDEFTALREIGLGVGRIVACLFAGLLLTVAPLAVVLAITVAGTALCAGASVILSHREKTQLI